MPFYHDDVLFGAAAISGIPPFNGFASKWIIYESASDGGFGNSYCGSCGWYQP